MPGMRTLLVLGALALPGCGLGADERSAEQAALLTGGDPGRGRALIRARGCNTCHTVPGVPGADATVGPPLAGIAGRMYIAGVLTNTPGNLVRWIQDPPSVDSLTAMPNVGLTEAEARDIAAYLYSLE
ncbi:MAG TPA: c-type cytochrome [Longimicrobiaceae bacterium]|nr:c-type cytochrome [Longimicrobiaceae bacterium]